MGVISDIELVSMGQTPKKTNKKKDPTFPITQLYIVYFLQSPHVIADFANSRLCKAPPKPTEDTIPLIS